jgi:hypothetical protein
MTRNNDNDNDQLSLATPWFVGMRLMGYAIQERASVCVSE